MAMVRPSDPATTLAVLHDENTRLKEKVRKLSGEATDLTNENLDLRNEITRRRAQKRELKATIEELRDKIAEYKYRPSSKPIAVPSLGTIMLGLDISPEEVDLRQAALTYARNVNGPDEETRAMDLCQAAARYTKEHNEPSVWSDDTLTKRDARPGK